MNVLLIYPNITDYPVDISQGLALISAMLKSKNHNVELFDCTFGYSKKKLKKSIFSFKPGIIGIPAASNDFIFVKKICKYIKTISDVLIICGSYLATISPGDILQNDCFDIAVIGEGEYTLLEIIQCIEKENPLDNVSGIWFKKNNKIIKNPVKKLNQHLDKLPFPDKDIFNYQKYLDFNRRLATFISSYGCPYECSYCINSYLMKMYKKNLYVRYKPIDYLIKEIKLILGKYKVREIEFYDETFTLNKKRVLEFCNIYSKEIKLPFYINSRVDTIDEELLYNLKKAGCVRISMGIECGDEYVRNKILKRNHSNRQIIESFKMVKKTGIKTFSFNMIGIPFENKESIKKTIELNRICKPDYLAVSIFNAYKGTWIYEICKKKGWLRDDFGNNYFQTTNIKHPELTLKQLIKIRNNFSYQVFKEIDYKRAVIEYIDKRMVRNHFYSYIRSLLIRSGIKKIL